MAIKWSSYFRDKQAARMELRRITLLLTATLAYGALFSPLQSFWGSWISFLVLAPVGLAGWLFGAWSGAAWGLLCWLFTGLLWQVNGLLTWGYNLGGWAVISLVLNLLIGFTSGWIRENRQRQSRLSRLDESADLERIKLALSVAGSYEASTASAVDFIPDAAFAINREGCLVAWNSAMETLTGILAKDVLGSGTGKLAQCLYGEARPLLVDAVLNKSLPTAALYPGLEQKDGALVVENYLPRLKPGGMYLWSKAGPLLNLEGGVVGAVQVLRDVTEARLIAEKNALASQRDEVTGLFGLDYFLQEAARLENIPVYPVSLVLVKLSPAAPASNVQTMTKQDAAVEDNLLRRAGMAIAATFRASDVMARLGERELGVLLPKSDAGVAQRIADRLRKALGTAGSQGLSFEFNVTAITCQESGTLTEALKEIVD